MHKIMHKWVLRMKIFMLHPFRSQPVLAEKAQFLNEKIRIMALIDLAFKKDAKGRNMDFNEIAAVCRLEGEVKFLN